MAEMRTNFSFEISLSVLNHLGRNLYRSFLTVLGEAISNSWDADAENVHIYFDKDNNSFVIKDDGIGMTADDFQNKFLKIGYSKRKEGYKSKTKDRPFIGRKGIGKLALLSCAEKIHVLTKTASTDYVGGIIDNTGLDKAIKDDLNPDQYQLGDIKVFEFKELTKDHTHGTIIKFENMKDGIRNSIDFLKKMIAYYFRFSLVDGSFKIFIDDELITLDQLEQLVNNTQFLWIINDLDDPFIYEKLKTSNNLKEVKNIGRDIPYQGFIASVDLPKGLKVISTDEKIGIDLFVNGRLREKDILKYIPTARLVESYLYGQIHFKDLDNGAVDRFTSSREGIIADDPEFDHLLKDLKEVLSIIMDDWDKWRIKYREPGDPDNTRITERERSSRNLFNAVSNDYAIPVESPQKRKIDTWVNTLADDAQFDFTSYAECFISENLIRMYIKDKKIVLSSEATQAVTKCRKKFDAAKQRGKLSIEIRQSDDDIAYLAMDDLAYLVDNKKSTSEPCLANDADSYKPIRDALMHTSLLTEAAKKYLTAVYENIKGRLNKLLSNP